VSQRKLAAKVIRCAMEDSLLANNETITIGGVTRPASCRVKETAIKFLFSNHPEYKRLREHWCSMAGMSPDNIQRRIRRKYNKTELDEILQL